jgi:hypothetical protein
MGRPRVVTDLQVWMIETGRNDVSLAVELTAKVNEPNQEISERTVARWRKQRMARMRAPTGPKAGIVGETTISIKSVQTTGTRLATTAAGEMISISSGTRQRSV